MTSFWIGKTPRWNAPFHRAIAPLLLLLLLLLFIAGVEAFRPSLPVPFRAHQPQQQHQRLQHTSQHTSQSQPQRRRRRRRPLATTITARMCICVDCQWVASCKAYHFVETKHKQPHMSEAPTFLPREGSPTIQVNIRTEPRDNRERRLWMDRVQAQEDEDEHKQEQDQEHERAPSGDRDDGDANGTVDDATNNDNDNPVVSIPGESSGGTSIESVVVTNTITTIEYDVVECEDFVLDKGCWVRNMPDEIKTVNPGFVPT